MKNKLTALRARSNQLAVAAGSLVVSGGAFAALPEGATTAFTTLQTDGLALLDLAWPVAIAITGGFILLKLFKRAANRAS